MRSNYEQLIAQLDRFIRKYYLNQLIRGLLYSTGLILLLFLAISLLEYFFYFDRGVRKLMFFSFLGISLLALGRWVFLPLLHYFRLGKIISHQQAAQIIGQHFTNVEDKLLNILQLREQAHQSPQSDLVLASIEQKTDEIKLVPFPKAINLGQNRKYLRYALPPLLVLLVLLFAAPSMITDSTTRLIRNNQDFEREAPFQFVLEKEDQLKAVQFEDFPLTVKVEGEVLPNEVFIDVDDYEYRLKKIDASTFVYTFKNVQKPVDFHFSSGGFRSKNYALEVLQKPNLANFTVQLDYPAYTGRKNEDLNNVGDLVVPAGTKINWTFTTENTDEMGVRLSPEEEPQPLKRLSPTTYTLSKTAARDALYYLFFSNEALPQPDSVAYSLAVIPDLYPTISVEKFVDSTDQEMLFFIGDASDDYGLLSLSFNYQIKHADGSSEPWQKEALSRPTGKQIQYDYTWDLSQLGLAPGDEIAYYFEVYDNDGFNGSKPARTQQMVFNKPTKEEYEQMSADNSEDIKDNLKKAREESQKLQSELQKLREKLLQEKDVDWQTREEFEKLLEKQQEIEQQMEKAKEQFQENLKNQDQFSETSEETKEKQEQLEELMEEAIDQETQELMEKIQELMQELNKEQALEMMEDMQFDQEQKEQNLERLEELYKQLEMEKAMQDQINELEKLAEQQEQLAEETEEQAEQQDNQSSEEAQQKQEELQKEQEEINEAFEKAQEKMEELMQKNEELENPKDLGDKPEEKMEDIQQDLENSQEQLQQQQNKKASKSQKSAAQQMKEMAQQMSSQMQSGDMQQMQEDMQTLRQLLENLVGLSFEQETLMDNFKGTGVYTPRYTELVENQFKLIDDFRLIEDSLQALAKRQIQIEGYVMEKVADIKKYMKKSVDELEERRKRDAAAHQQFTMKNVNDLALMLSETMQQMQQQMSGQMAGSQMCNNPGQGQPKEGKVPMDKISQGQQQLGDQMQKSMQQGETGQGGQPSSQELAEMAARQAALRKALEEMRREKMLQGEDAKDLQEIIDQMNETEKDLVNKRLSNRTLRRQQDILTRLLQHEKAERERGFDEKRKSETASQNPREYPPALQEYLKKREAEVEIYRQVSPSLRPYYKFLVEEYYKELKQ